MTLCGNHTLNSHFSHTFEEPPSAILSVAISAFRAMLVVRQSCSFKVPSDSLSVSVLKSVRIDQLTDCPIDRDSILSLKLSSLSFTIWSSGWSRFDDTGLLKWSDDLSLSISAYSCLTVCVLSNDSRWVWSTS
jgi:hypothetical protein